MLTLYLIKVDELEIINGYGIEWYRIWKKLIENELRKWSATGPNDSVLVAAVIKNEHFGYCINKMTWTTITYINIK